MAKAMRGFDDEIAAQKARWGLQALVSVFGLPVRRVAPEMRARMSVALCDCPVCGRGVIVGREDDRGGRCNACQRGFDVAGLLSAARGYTFHEAVLTLKRHDPDGPGDGKTGRLL